MARETQAERKARLHRERQQRYRERHQASRLASPSVTRHGDASSDAESDVFEQESRHGDGQTSVTLKTLEGLEKEPFTRDGHRAPLRGAPAVTRTREKIGRDAIRANLEQREQWLAEHPDACWHCTGSHHAGDRAWRHDGFEVEWTGTGHYECRPTGRIQSELQELLKAGRGSQIPGPPRQIGESAIIQMHRCVVRQADDGEVYLEVCPTP